MGFPPTAFLIGAQKAGTTYLAGLLDQQPGLALSRPKEPHFFTRNRERGQDWYRACFPDPGPPVLLDASPSYAAAPLHLRERVADPEQHSRLAGVPRRIREMSPNARFIYLLRDPVDRTYSAYWHEVRAGNESLPFAEALEADPVYLNASDYAGQAREYMRHFPRDRILFLWFEDLGRAPEAVVARCLEFLELSGEVAEAPEVGIHGGARPGRMARAVAWARNRVPGARGLEQGVWQALPGTVRSGIRGRLFRPIPPLEPEDRDRLRERLGPTVAPLAELAGDDPALRWPWTAGWLRA